MAPTLQVPNQQVLFKAADSLINKTAPYINSVTSNKFPDLPFNKTLPSFHGLNPKNLTDLKPDFGKIVHGIDIDWSFLSDAWNAIEAAFGRFAEWITSPETLELIGIFAAVLIAILALVLLLPVVGFGALGIVGESLAASFQSVVYGAWTVAGSFFAILTRAGMVGVGSGFVFFAIAVALLVALIVGLLR